MVAEIDDIASIVLGFMQHGCGCRLCCRLCLVRAWHGALESTYAGGTYYKDFMLEAHGDEQYNKILNRGLGDQERDGGDKDELWHATTCATSQAKDRACADAHYDRRTTRREKADMNNAGHATPFSRLQGKAWCAGTSQRPVPAEDLAGGTHNADTVHESFFKDQVY